MDSLGTLSPYMDYVYCAVHIVYALLIRSTCVHVRSASEQRRRINYGVRAIVFWVWSRGGNIIFDNGRLRR